MNHLNEQFNIKSTINKIYIIRKKYFIPCRNNRTTQIYLQYEKHYSNIIELTRENIVNYKDISSVYELISLDEYKYNYKNSKTVYIGSTNNLQRRLTQYLDNFGHTNKLRNFMSANQVYFRLIKTDNYKDLERDILNAFYTIYGNYPLLNTNRIL